MSSKDSGTSESQLLQELEALHGRCAELERLAASHQEERKKLTRVNRFLSAIRQCNEALLHAPSETDLMQAICRIIVEVAGYKLAWVAFAGHDQEKTVRPVAKFGEDQGFFTDLNLRWAETGPGQCPSGKAIRTGQPVVVSHILEDLEFETWREEALKRGFQSSISIPLAENGPAFGVISIFAAEPKAFDQEELALLRELADDMAFGIMALRTQGERRQAIAAAEAAKLERTRIFQAMGNPALILDENQKVTAANKAMTAATGLAEAELMGRTCHSIWDSPVPENCPYQRARSGKPAQAVERVLEALEGTFLVACTPELDPQGELRRVIVIATDLTEYQQMTENLRQAEAKYRSIVENSVEGIFQTTLDGRYLSANPALTRMLGYESPQELVAGITNIAQQIYVDPNRRDEFQRLMAERGEVRDFEFQAYRKDGSVIWINVNARAARDEQGAFLYYEGSYEDITERKRAEAERDALAEQRQLALNAAQMGWWHYDPITRIASWDDRYKEIFGVSGHQRPNEEILARLHPEDLPKVWAAVEAALDPAHPQPYVAEYRVNRPDGSVCWVEAYGLAIFEGEGPARRATSFVGTVRDITARKRAAEALRESEAKYKSLIDNFKDIIFTIDLTGQVTFASPSTKEILGYESAETLGMNLLDFLPEEDRQRAIETLPQGMKGNKITNYQTPALKKSGERVFLELTFSRVYRDGVVIGAEAIAKDITDRKRAEEALGQTHQAIEASRSFLALANLQLEVPQLLRAFVSEIKDYTGCEAVGIRILDEDGNIPYQAYEGFDRQFYESESPLSIKSDQCMCINVIKGDTDAAQPFYTEAGSFYMNGTTRFLATVSEEAKGRTRNVCNQVGYESVALVPIRFADRILGLVHLADRREGIVPLHKVQNLESMAAQLGNALQRIWAAEGLKRAEEEVRKHRDHLQEMVAERTAQLEEANQELQAFSYSVSHDLRTPLRAIQGFSQILLEEHSAQLDAEGKRYLEVVSANTKQMGTLIDDLLTLSRLGRIEMRTGEIDMKDLAEAVFRELERVVPERKLELVLSDLAPARGDRGLIRQVLVNLLSNAVKFSRPRKVGVIQIGSSREKDETVYFVKDNGVGFNMKYGNKLFGVFQRLHSAEEFEGTGVGLAIVQRIIHRHGGRVWAEGNVGEGATFYFTLGKA